MQLLGMVVYTSNTENDNDNDMGQTVLATGQCLQRWLAKLRYRSG